MKYKMFAWLSSYHILKRETERTAGPDIEIRVRDNPQ